jgi:hypoxanthine phosphoribosyltransferase
MKYITLAEMGKAVRQNIHKIPRDIDFVIGIPRSGVLAASIVCEYLNCPLIDLDSFCAGAKPTGGARLRYWEPRHTEGKKKVLVVDDTTWDGRSKRTAKAKLQPFLDDYDFIFMVVFLEGPGKSYVDFWLEDVTMYTNNFRDNVLYEWNIFHHNEGTMYGSMWDIDGVFCLDPPDERNTEKYLEYIKNATPLFIPTPTIGGICSYRLEKNRAVTEEWLSRNGVKYGSLQLFPADTWEQRNASGISPERFKADRYGAAQWAKIFFESDDWQARRIFELTGKQVYCIETNKMYG